MHCEAEAPRPHACNLCALCNCSDLQFKYKYAVTLEPRPAEHYICSMLLSAASFKA